MRLGFAYLTEEDDCCEDLETILVQSASGFLCILPPTDRGASMILPGDFVVGIFGLNISEVLGEKILLAVGGNVESSKRRRRVLKKARERERERA